MAALTLLAASANAADEKGSVNFSGNLKGLKDTLIVITPTEQGMKRDTVLTKDGQFNFTVNVEKPMDIYAYTPGTLRQEERIGFSAIAVPGEKAVLTGDLNSAYYYSGSKFYEQFNEADRANDAAMKPLSDLMASLEKRMANGEKQDVVSKEYEEKAPALQKQATEAMVDFIAKHPDSGGRSCVHSTS